MFANKELYFFSEEILRWYLAHKRDLPWRNTENPYHIWLSEIILQQTRVVQGYDYYLRFIKAYPAIFDLAKASEMEVLKLWQGLGYYSRARNLHATAKQIVEKYNGIFPKRYEDVCSLKGIGQYTAAAICSFAYNQPFAVVDGNVYRVLSRLFGIDAPIDSTAGKKQFAGLAQQLLNKEKSALHNQAIMEFGALQCTPQPDCSACVLQANCFAFVNKKVNLLPVKARKTKVSTRYFNYFFIHSSQDTYLRKRIAADVWRNLYELPLIETAHDADLTDLLNSDFLSKLKNVITFEGVSPAWETKHVLSHQIIRAKFYITKIQEKIELPDFEKIPLTGLSRYPVSRLTELFLSKFIK